MNRVQERIAEVEQEIRAAGFRLIYRRFVEDAKTPGFPGHIAGRVDRADREVVVGELATSGSCGTPSPIRRLRVLKHELHHITDPDWDCGCRAIYDNRPNRAGVPERL